MNRKAFLLGFYSIGSQVLILRELVASFNGDELFIGTALFGWLISVAFGAYIGGKSGFKITPGWLFSTAILILPILIIAVRFSPLAVTDFPGEIIPFFQAAGISILASIPIGLITGALFPAICREGYRPAATIARIYLFEGIGAFLGGVLITLLVGPVFSNLGMAVALGIVTAGYYCYKYGGARGVIQPLVILALLIAVLFIIPSLDYSIDSHKYKPFTLTATVDSHYGRHAILTRDNSRILISNNSVEASYPNLAVSENLLIPPLLYKPDAVNVLFIGRIEFGIMQLAKQLGNLSITSIDPRKLLSESIDNIITYESEASRKESDPISFITKSSLLSKYDIIILNPGEPDNYLGSRYITARFFNLATKVLKTDGILYYPTNYDSDRYISSEKANLLSIIQSSLEETFSHHSIWPGEMTLFFASHSPIFGIPLDTIISRVSNLSYAPQFISPEFITDRLNEIKIDRLTDAVENRSIVNSLERPILPIYQAIYRSTAGGGAEKTIKSIYDNTTWIIALPILIVLLCVLFILKRPKRRHFGLFIYFTAGLVSLSFELISFYVYQTMAGSLYSEIGILVGAFMLGLAAGTYASLKSNSEHLEFPGLLLMGTITLLFMATYRDIPPQAMLIYHALFLFTVAIATGSLFVAATNRFYYGKASANRGTGYALEIAGSAFGALFSMTVILPVVGLKIFLIALLGLIIVTFAGAVFTS
jgi:hypothetical protein